MKIKKALPIKIILSLLFFVVTVNSYAKDEIKQDKPSWELGLGVGGLSMPHYRGSDQRAEYVSPIPYIRYNGERFKVDREGGRFYF